VSSASACPQSALDEHLESLQPLSIESWDAVLEADRTFEVIDVGEEDFAAKFASLDSLRALRKAIQGLSLLRSIKSSEDSN